MPDLHIKRGHHHLDYGDFSLYWTRLDKNTTDSLLFLKHICPFIIPILEGSYPFGRNTERLEMPSNDFWMNCGSEEDKEIVFHLIVQCPVLIINRLRFLNFHFLTSKICFGLELVFSREFSVWNINYDIILDLNAGLGETLSVKKNASLYLAT